MRPAFVRSILPAACVVFCLAGAASAAGVKLVQGTASMPNAAERRYGAAVTRRLSQWLDEIGVAHDVVTDEAVAGGALREARVAILGYNPVLPEAAREALIAYLRGGGKLIVFYSSDAILADAMGFRLGEYRSAAGAGGRWAAMVFNEQAPPGVPPVVEQASGNIRPVYPAAAGSAVIAYWRDGAGERTGEPAWTRSARGFWMSHVFLADGDIDRKQRLLLALLGVCDPALWAVAAERRAARVEQFHGYRGIRAARRGLRAQPNGRDPAVTCLLDAIGDVRERLRRELASGAPIQAYTTALALERLLIRAYAVAQRGRAGERRGIWDHDGTGLFPGDWDRTCRVLSDAGLTDIFANVLWPAAADYESSVLPASEMLKRHGDQVAAAVTAAHKAGLRYHAWKVCWRLDGIDAAGLAALRREDRLQVTSRGEVRPWLCPSDPRNIEHELAAIREVARRYAVDGIHLDYIRYPDAYSCFCSRCRRQFTAALGREPDPWPIPPSKTGLWRAYSGWRNEVMTEFVRQVRRTIRAESDAIRLSAAVFGSYPSCRDSVAQDWVSWLRDGTLDFVCPMNYTEDLDRFRSYLAEQVRAVGGPERIWTGIGVTADESRLTAPMTIDQIKAARTAGLPGFVLFDLNAAVAHDLLPLLQSGITAPPASSTE